MLWRDFAPYVVPFVIGAPMPVLEHHARLIAIDWCQKTGCWTRDLDAEIADGLTHTIDIVAPSSQIAVVRPIAVSVAGKERDLVTPRDGQRFVRSQHPGDFCFTPDNRVLHVYPLEQAGTEVVVTAMLKPALDRSSGLDDEIATQYANDIAWGIIASIQRLPKQDFSDPASARDHQTMYEDRRSTIAAKIARGIAAAKTRSQPGYL